MSLGSQGMQKHHETFNLPCPTLNFCNCQTAVHFTVSTLTLLSPSSNMATSPIEIGVLKLPIHRQKKAKLLSLHLAIGTESQALFEIRTTQS